MVESFAYGQKVTKQVADSVCVCLYEKLANTLDENLKDTLNKCIGSFTAKYSSELFEEYNLEGYTVENIRFLQSKIIARLEKKCAVYKDLKK